MITPYSLYEEIGERLEAIRTKIQRERPIPEIELVLLSNGYAQLVTSESFVRKGVLNGSEPERIENSDLGALNDLSRDLEDIETLPAAEQLEEIEKLNLFEKIVDSLPPPRERRKKEKRTFTPRNQESPYAAPFSTLN